MGRSVLHQGQARLGGPLGQRRDGLVAAALPQACSIPRRMSKRPLAPRWASMTASSQETVIFEREAADE